LVPASVHPIVEVLSPARPEIAARAFGCGSRGAIHKFSPQSRPIRDGGGGTCLSSRCHRMPTDRSRARHESSKPSGYGYSLLIMAHHACARPTEAQGTLVRNQSGPADLSRCTARGKVNWRFRDGHNPQELNDANSARHESALLPCSLTAWRTSPSARSRRPDVRSLGPRDDRTTAC